MNFSHKPSPEETHRMLLMEAGGSIQIVHQALSEVARETESRHISIELVVDRIRNILNKRTVNNKIPA